MPVAVGYPGAYVEAVASGVRTITGVATSITALVGRAVKGQVNQATTIDSYADFERLFGGLWAQSKLGYAVRDFYLNGGSQALIVRLYAPDGAASRSQPRIKGKAPFIAIDEGAWGQNLRITINADIPPQVAAALGLPDTTSLFNLSVAELRADGTILRSEQFRNLSLGSAIRSVDKVINAESELVRWQGDGPMAGVFQLTDIHANRGLVLAARKALADALAASPQLDAAIKAAQDALDLAQGKLAELTLDDIQLAEQVVAAKLALWAARRDAKVPVQAGIDAALATVETARLAVDRARQAALGSDGAALTAADFTPALAASEKTGLFALDAADLFNLLCIPPYRDEGVEPALLAAAAAYCERRRAMLLVDPLPAWNSAAAAIAGVAAVGTNSKNAALFFPMLRQPDPLRDNQPADFAPCGAVAGVIARTDAERGVWKAPAGMDAALAGVPALSVALTDAENGQLNPLGINCLRAMPPAGRIVWGTRTMQGDDRLASEWKYLPVRRTALYIEESLYRGTRWVMFEPNDEPLWAQIRLNLGAFMQNMFRQGAFQGKTPQAAYFVKCDKETTTQNDIKLGIVNIAVGFAPLKPAEFVIIKLQQIAGQVQANA